MQHGEADMPCFGILKAAQMCFAKRGLEVAGSFCFWLQLEVEEALLGNSTGDEAPDSAASGVGSEISMVPHHTRY